MLKTEAGLGLQARCSSQESLTLGNLQIQSEESRLVHWWRWCERKHLYINWICVAVYRIAAADSEPARKKKN
jgi:hypothetical protein